MFFLWMGENLIFPDIHENIMYKIDYPWNYLLFSSSMILYALFHKRRRVIYQGLQTRENNKNHEAVDRVRFPLFFLACKTREQNENHEAACFVIFFVLVCFTNAREQWKWRGDRQSPFHCSRIFVNPGKWRDMHLWNSLSIF